MIAKCSQQGLRSPQGPHTDTDPPR